MNATFATVSLIAICVTFWKHSSASASKNPACSVTPEVENCTIVLFRWSYDSALNECKQNFVCRENANNFQTKDICETSCPPVPVVTPCTETKGLQLLAH
ncbi:hypothetical protein MTO96_037426 [Rhipicephalus appendiculatus]